MTTIRVAVSVINSNQKTQFFVLFALYSFFLFNYFKPFLGNIVEAIFVPSGFFFFKTRVIRYFRTFDFMQASFHFKDCVNHNRSEV